MAATGRRIQRKTQGAVGKSRNQSQFCLA